MDKGAHFYKCDFQVHTPRDSQWSGTEAITPEERQAYAKELIQACRDKGLHAIAITDHHDFVFYPYIRTAAKEEIAPDGQPFPEEEKIIVFPGVELTLSSPPCQVIVILDAHFDESKLNDVLTVLTIAQVDPSKSKLPSVTSVSPTSITGLNNLEETLNQHLWLKGKFTILPNVTSEGYKTIFRDGFTKHYQEMRCVGGYIDGDYAKSKTGHKNIFEGRQINNGFKALAVFQTSDNRDRNHFELGVPSTYVKWSVPTAEALRQACLAKQSRLSHNEPALPSIWVTYLKVSNSKFLGKIDLHLNQQLNAIIGGRGTGKSTILEYLRWGLCDQSIESEEIDVVQTKRKNLIDNTLQKVDGEVTVGFYLNGVHHAVRRDSKKNEIFLQIGSSDFSPATEQQIRSLLPIQAYSQKQLSSVGVRVDELKRFVELPIKQKLDDIRSELRNTAANMRAAYGHSIRMSEIEVEVQKNNVEITSLSEQLTALRNSLKGLSEEDQKLINLKSKYDLEEGLIEGLHNKLAIAKSNIELLVDSFNETEQKNDPPEDIENKEAIRQVQEKFNAKFLEIESAVTSLSNLLSPQSLVEINESVSIWENLREEFIKKYEETKTKANDNKLQLQQIQTLEQRIALLRKQQTEKQNALTTLGDPKATYVTLRKYWDELHTRKLAELKSQCTQFTDLSDGLIKADLSKGLDTFKLTQKLKQAFIGMIVREEKLDRACQGILNSTDPFSEWNTILTDLEHLAKHSNEASTALPNTPTLDKYGFIESEKSRIGSMFDSSKWLELSVTELEFNPKFHYCSNKKTNEYIDFKDASAGQQATALLTVLLNQTGAPLIIDQPEDDIDSRMVRDIVELVWKAKCRRQLVFASHSANFVVNGDAELVVCCDYVKTGDQTKGIVKAVGAIDSESIKEEITSVTEGGKEAFKLRMEKYGF
ncbi:MAG TPA: AAA family ATPase [Verrucomicrobiae bacterium]